MEDMKESFDLRDVPKFTIEDLSYSEQTVGEILSLEEACFPPDWQYDDAQDHYTEALKDSANINLFLKEGNKVIGYLLARPHNTMVAELHEDDPSLQASEESRFYIETIQILPSAQGKGGGKALLVAICEKAKERGVERFSIHARTKNNLNETVKKIFGERVTLVRPIESWVYASGEPYEYIEWKT